MSVRIRGDNRGFTRRKMAFWLPVGVIALIMAGAMDIEPGAARAATIQLRSECRCQRPVVTLGELADVYAADSQQANALAAVELFPTPPAGRQRFVRVGQIEDLLRLRGINLLEHEFSGASQVLVHGSGSPAGTEDERPVSVATADRARRQVCDAVVRYLQEYVLPTEPWSVAVALDENQVRTVAGGGRTFSVRGGMAPWVGSQRFEVVVGSSTEPARFMVDAEVSLPPAVVVATRSLSRGMLISAADVKLQRGTSSDKTADKFYSLDEVVGRETTRMIPQGKSLDKNSVRCPLLVRRGRPVTVYARSSGILVRTTARALDDGSLGELVTVESLLDRKRYFAQVCGVGEVEVLARAVRTGPVAPARQSVVTDLGSTPGKGRSW